MKEVEIASFGMETALKGLERRGYVPKFVYDIGAADGSWTRQALKYWPNSTYICFEPLKERQVALNELKESHPGQIHIHNCGVGDSDTELSIGITDSLWDSSFAYSGTSSRMVVIKKLDSLVEQGTPLPSFIKIDVQGFEKRVIDGGISVIKHADLILMECTFFSFCNDMRTLDETILYMSEHGFIPYEFVDFLRRPLDGAMGQCDILFIRKDHQLVSNKKWG